MTVYLVGAGPGDPGLLTVRGAELLATADVVVHDRLISGELLGLAAAGAELIDVGKRPGDADRQAEINRILIEKGSSQGTVVRLKGGDPFLFGRGGEEAAALEAAGVAFEVVPGVPSAFAVPAYAGVPVTQRGVAASVTVVTGHVQADGPGAVDWDALARGGGTLVILMGLATKAEIAKRLVEGGRKPTTPVLVVEKGTTPNQRTVSTTLEELANVEVTSPSTIVVGEVAGRSFEWFEHKALHGMSVVVTRSIEQRAGLAGALAEAGAEVIELPVISISGPADPLALDDAARHLERYEWVVFTSANGVAALLGRLPDSRSLAHNRVAAVGGATTATLRRFGVEPDLVPADASAEGLAAAMPPPLRPSGGPQTGSSPGAGGTEKGTVLFPRSSKAPPTLADRLGAKGWRVHAVEAYATRIADPGPHNDALALRASSADVVTFTSPSTVEGFLSVMRGRVPPPTVACIGPTTEAEARARGLEVDVVAKRHDAQGLVEALVERRRSRGGHRP